MLHAQRLHGPEELGAQVVVAALALDGFGQEAGDVVGVSLEGGPRLGQRLGFRGLDRGQVVGDREDRGGAVDAGPVELGEAGDLIGLRVGERHRVAAAAVEGLAQVQHLRAQRLVAAVHAVVPRLPVERGLQDVLDGQRTALDEEVARQRRVAQHAGEGVDEAGHLQRVHVRVGRLVARGLEQRAAEVLVVRHTGMVHAQRRGGEEREHVEVASAVARVHEPGAAALRGVEHHVEAVDEQMPGERVVHLVGVDHGASWGRGWSTARRGGASPSVSGAARPRSGGEASGLGVCDGGSCDDADGSSVDLAAISIGRPGRTTRWTIWTARCCASSPPTGG